MRPAAWSPSEVGPVIEVIVPPRRWSIPREPPETEEVLARRRQTQVTLMERLFGAAGWAALTPCQRRIVDMLMLEIVPARNGWRPGYSPEVRLIVGSPPGRDQAPIPFWVNGGRLPRGVGHCLGLPTRGSFIVRTGYAQAYELEQEYMANVPRFVQDVQDVAGVLAVDLVGSSGDFRDGIGLERMVSMTVFDWSLNMLCPLSVRGFPRQEYLTAWRQHFADRNRCLTV